MSTLSQFLTPKAERIEDKSALEIQALQLIEMRVISSLLAELPRALDLAPGLYIAPDLTALRNELSTLKD